ncbi:hypothetical protein V3C33_02190 [Micrococcaceae bacterium Sec5.7]
MERSVTLAKVLGTAGWANFGTATPMTASAVDGDLEGATDEH